MTDFAQPNHYWVMFMHHRDRCAMCRGENFIRTSALLCTYGKYLADKYNAVIQRSWKNVEFWNGSPPGLDKILEYRSRPAYWMGSFWSKCRSVGMRYRPKWLVWTCSLVVRIVTSLARTETVQSFRNYNLRDLSSQGLAVQTSYADHSDDPHYRFVGGIRSHSWNEMGGTRIISISDWDEMGGTSTTEV